MCGGIDTGYDTLEDVIRSKDIQIGELKARLDLLGNHAALAQLLAKKDTRIAELENEVADMRARLQFDMA